MKYKAFKDTAEDRPELPDDNLGITLRGEFDDVAAERWYYEQSWLRDLRQYMGQYDPEVEQAIQKDKSRSNIKATRVKVRTMDARMMDMLFPAGSAKNWEIKSTPIPEVSTAEKQRLSQIVMQQMGEQPDDEVLDEMIKDLAERRCERMSEAIEDQLTEENRYVNTAGRVVHNGHLYGTGILKGPMVDKQVRKRWTRQIVDKGAELHVIEEQEQRVPYFESVSIWDFYPDLSATEIEDCDYIWQRHVMPRHKVRQLASRGFDRQVINEYLRAYPDGDSDYLQWESDLRELNGKKDSTDIKRKKYVVLERWGTLSGKELADCGCKIPEEQQDMDFEAHIWLLGDYVIRAKLNPSEADVRPYHLYYFEKDETSVFGLSVPWSIRDPSSNYNALIRAGLDNAGATAGPQFEVNLDLLDPNESPGDGPGPFRVWFRRGKGDEARHPAVRSVEVESRIKEIMQLAEHQKLQMDEVSLIPSYMHGDADKGGAGNTASGLSMLMGAANIMMKEAIRNYDKVTKSFISAMYHWNMQFGEDESIKGDFEVIATGSTSLVSREVRTQQMLQFSQATMNEFQAPWVKWRDLTVRYARDMELGEDIIKTEEEAKQEQEQAMQAQMQAQAAAQQQGGPPQ